MSKGFSLIELLIALAIIAILSAFAYPQYSQYLVRTKRLEATHMLTRLSLALEQFYLEHGSYTGATLASLKFPENLGGNYKIAMSVSENNYFVEAQPLGFQQQKDVMCGTLQLNDLDEKRITGNGLIEECW